MVCLFFFFPCLRHDGGFWLLRIELLRDLLLRHRSPRLLGARTVLAPLDLKAADQWTRWAVARQCQPIIYSYTTHYPYKPCPTARITRTTRTTNSSPNINTNTNNTTIKTQRRHPNIWGLRASYWVCRLRDRRGRLRRRRLRMGEERGFMYRRRRGCTPRSRRARVRCLRLRRCRLIRSMGAARIIINSRCIRFRVGAVVRRRIKMGITQMGSHSLLISKKNQHTQTTERKKKTNDTSD